MKLIKLAAVLVCVLLLPLWGFTSAAADGQTSMGVQTGLESYAIDLERIYQGGRYEAVIRIGENMSFSGTLTEGLTHEQLWLCIDRALADEHLTRQDIIETNKMVDKLLDELEPSTFWERVEFITDAIGVQHYADTVKHMSASSGLDGELEGLTALEKQYVQEQLGKQMGESYDKWREGLIPGKVKDKVVEKALGAMSVGAKAVKIAVGVWKLAEAGLEEDKELSELRERALARQTAVEIFYKRAGNYVREYLDEYGQWELRFDGSKLSGSAYETMTRLNFDANDTRGVFSTFYTIQPIKLTWTADAYFLKDDHSPNPNGTYTGRISITGEYDASELKKHIAPLIFKFEQYSLAMNYSMYNEEQMQALERATPDIRQTWFIDNCQIEILGLAENGAATVELPPLVENTNITMDYELSGGYSAAGSSAVGVDQVCTPERAAAPIRQLPEQVNGEVMNWVCLIPLSVTVSDPYSGSHTYSAEEMAGVGDLDTAFVIRSPFADWTGFKRIEISKNRPEA